MHRAANPLGLPAGSFFEAFLPTSLEGVQNMAMRVEYNPLEAALAALLANGLDGAGEALRILVNEASKIERARFLHATPHERTEARTDYANGFKPKTVMTRLGEQTFDVPQVRGGGFYPSALEKGSRTGQRSIWRWPRGMFKGFRPARCAIAWSSSWGRRCPLFNQ